MFKRTFTLKGSKKRHVLTACWSISFTDIALNFLLLVGRELQPWKVLLKYEKIWWVGCLRMWSGWLRERASSSVFFLSHPVFLLLWLSGQKPLVTFRWIWAVAVFKANASFNMMLLFISIVFSGGVWTLCIHYVYLQGTSGVEIPWFKKEEKNKKEEARDSERSSLRSRAHRQRSHDPVPVPIILTFKRFDIDGTEIL